MIITLTEKQCKQANKPLGTQIEIELNEARKLIKVKATASSKMYTLKWADTNDIKKMYTYSGTKEQFIKFLQSIKAKDTLTEPASKRNYSYKDLADGIISGKDNEIWVWTTNLNPLPAKKEI